MSTAFRQMILLPLTQSVAFGVLALVMTSGCQGSKASGASGDGDGATGAAKGSGGASGAGGPHAPDGTEIEIGSGRGTFPEPKDSPFCAPDECPPCEVDGCFKPYEPLPPGTICVEPEANDADCSTLPEEPVPATSCGLKPSSAGAISEYFAQFKMPVERDGCIVNHRPSSQRGWSVLLNGRCGGCKIPSRISSAANGDAFIVSWAASAPYGDIEDPATNERRIGHLSTFKFTEAEGFTKGSDFLFEECDFDMGSVTISDDGQVIGALCLATRAEDEFANVYIYEWTGGAVTQYPDRRTRVSHRAGKNFSAGHWDLSLNNDSSIYNITIRTNIPGGHVGMSRFAIERDAGGLVGRDWRGDIYVASDSDRMLEGGCGSHPNMGRIVHNEYDDTWSVFCRGDDHKLIGWGFVDPAKMLAGDAYPVGYYPRTSLTDVPGSIQNGISLGARGWLIAATGPFDIYEGLPTDIYVRKAALVDQQIGLRRLPNTKADLMANEDAYPWTWIPKEDVCAPVRVDAQQDPEERRLAGQVQLHNWGLGGEDSGRILMGYAPARNHTDANRELHVVEIDEQGNFLHEPVLLHRGGWGIDSLGTYMPGSGCVVFPTTDKPGAVRAGGGDYAADGDYASLENRSEYLMLTAVCPADCEDGLKGCASSTFHDAASSSCK